MSALNIGLVLFGQRVTGLSVPIGSTVNWTFDLLDPGTHDPIDLTVEGTAVMMSMSASGITGGPGGVPLIARQADAANDPVNRCMTQWVSGDTVTADGPLLPGTYVVDVWVQDADGNRLQSWYATILLTAAVTLPGALVTPLPSTPALGIGPPGSSVVWRDAYDADTSYNPLDMVSLTNGDQTSSYICIATTTGHDPTNATYWALMATGGGGGSGLPDPTGHPDGSALVLRGGVWVIDKITSDDLGAAFAVSAGFTNTGTVEVGASAASVIVSASYPNGAPSSASITDGTQNVNLSSPFTAGTLTGPYTSSTPNAQQNFSLSATKGGVTRSVSAARVYRARSFWGAGTPGALNAAFIQALASNGLTSGLAGSYGIGVLGGTKRAYVAWPTSYGNPSSFKDAGSGFAVPMSKVATATVTNGNGVALSYDVYASDNLLDAAFTLAVA